MSAEARLRDKRTNFGWENEIRLPNGWTLAGHSEGRSATGFVLVEPRIFLDAGMVCRKWSPHAVLLTHNHEDHSGQLPALLSHVESGGHHHHYHEPKIVCLPRRALDGAYACVAARRLRKFPRESRNDAMLRPHDDDPAGPTPRAPFEDALAIWVPMEGGDRVSLHRPTLRQELVAPATPHPFSSLRAEEETKSEAKPDRACEKLTVEAVTCVHSTDDVGYIISERREKLRDEFVGLDPKTLGAMARDKSVQLTRSINVPQLAYVCDTGIEVFANAHSAASILACPTVLIECNYLEAAMEREASERGHICWTQLAPIVAQNPTILFILFHFSQRYRSNDEIKAFFAAIPAEHRPSNVRLWLTGEVASL